MHDANTARCLSPQDMADTLVTEPMRDMGDTQEQPQEDLDGRLALLRAQVLGSGAPAPATAPEQEQSRLRSVHAAPERSNWMSHTRPDPPGLQMLADRHFEAPDHLVDTQQFQQQRQPPAIDSLKFASQAAAPAPAPAPEPEADPLACWDPEASVADPVATAPALAAFYVPAPVAAPEPAYVPAPAPMAAPVVAEPAPYAPAPVAEMPMAMAPVAEIPAAPMMIQAPELAPAPVMEAPLQPQLSAAPVAPHPLTVAQPSPVMFPGADMDVDASLEKDIDLYLYGRKRRWPWVVALVAVALAMVVGALLLTGGEEQRPWAGHVEVVSLPAGATVSMDGKSVGVTPVKLPLTRPGEKHQVTVTLSGHEDWSEKFTVSQEQPTVRLLAIMDRSLDGSGPRAALE